MSKKKESSGSEHSYREKIKERVGSGGGCAEAWEAAQELRSEESVSSGRRNFVAGIGASLLFGVSATKAVRAAGGDAPDKLETEVSELDGVDRAEAIEQALSDEEVTLVRKSLQSRDLSENRQSATAHKSVYGDEEYLTVKIPFETNRDSRTDLERSAGIIWSSWSSGLTHGFISEREVNRDATVSEDMKRLYEESEVGFASMDTVPVEHRYTIGVRLSTGSPREGVCHSLGQ